MCAFLPQNLNKIKFYPTVELNAFVETLLVDSNKKKIRDGIYKVYENTY
jgi:hypothetical protein